MFSRPSGRSTPPEEHTVERYGPLFLSDCAGRIGWPESLVARNVSEDVVVVPRVLGFFWLLHLYQHQVMNHQTVRPKLAVSREEVLDWPGAHLRGDLQRIVGARRLDGVEIMHC